MTRTCIMTASQVFLLQPKRFDFFFFGAMSSGNVYVKQWMNEQAFHSIPMTTAEVPSESMASKPVESKVVDVHVGNKRFKVTPELFMEEFPGAGGNPYPTADLRTSMAQPSCFAVKTSSGHGVGDHFTNTPKNQENWFKAEGVGKSEVPPGEPTTSLFEPLFASVWIDPLGGLLAHF